MFGKLKTELKQALRDFGELTFAIYDLLGK